MIYRILNTAILITVLNLVLMPGRTVAGELGLAFWNVENLFDTVDDPKTEGDEEFTPGEPKAWTETRL